MFNLFDTIKFKHGIDTYIVNTYPEKQCGTLMVATNRKGRTG